MRQVITICTNGLPKVKAVKLGPVNQQIVKAAKLAISEGLFAATGQYSSVSYVTNETVAEFLTRTDAAKLLARGPLTLAELVYAHGAPLWLGKCNTATVAAKLRRQLAQGDPPASAFVVQGAGLFCAGDKATLPIIEAIATGSLFIRSRATQMGGVTVLNRRQRDFINRSASYR